MYNAFSLTEELIKKKLLKSIITYFGQGVGFQLCKPQNTVHFVQHKKHRFN
jgi:hypothetical protein